jgi:hypothetical protein
VALIAPSGDPVMADSASQTGFLELTEKGFYELRRAGGRAEAIPVAVNVDVVESNLSRFEPVDLVTSALNRTSDGAGSGNPRNLTAVQKEKRQNLWWYLMVVALLLFAGETLLGNRLSPALRTRAS